MGLAYAIFDRGSRKVSWQSVDGAHRYGVRIYTALADGSPNHYNPVYSGGPLFGNEFTLPGDVQLETGLNNQMPQIVENKTTRPLNFKC